MMMEAELLNPAPPSRPRAHESCGNSRNDAHPSGLVLGIDPGVNGALALLTNEGALLDVVDMPTLADGTGDKKSINPVLLARQIEAWNPERAFVEFVAARPGEGPVGAFAFGRCRGAIEGVLGALNIPATMLAPAWWKRVVSIPPGKDGAKDAARSRAISRWPAKAGLFARVKDDGRAEACLIAVAGLTRGEAAR